MTNRIMFLLAHFVSKNLAAYCGEDGGERAATYVLEILTEFTRNIEDAINKYDSRKEQEAQKEARKKRAAESTTKAKETPRHNLFLTPSTDKKISQRRENDTVVKQGNTIDKTGSESEKENGFESCLKPQQQSVSKGNDDRSSQPYDPSKVLLQDIKMTKEVKSNNMELRSQELIGTTKLDSREALLQSIVKRQKPRVNAHKDSPNPLDPRQALLQSITNRRVENSSDNTPSNNNDLPSNRQIESSKHLDPRQALLQSINQRRVEKSSDESNNDDSPSFRSVMRSSRSLGCGIVPNWELAISTFDPS